MLALTKVELKGVDLLVLGVPELLIGNRVLRLQPLHLLTMLLRKPIKFITMLLLLSGHLVDVLLLSFGIGAISILQLLLQLLDLLDEALAILGLHVGVFLQLARCDDKLLLELLARPIRLSNHSLILTQISLQVVKDGLSFLETHQDTQLIVQLNFLLLEQELESVVLSLIQVCGRESLGSHGRCHP